jgi:hypothetical protein
VSSKGELMIEMHYKVESKLTNEIRRNLVEKILGRYLHVKTKVLDEFLLEVGVDDCSYVIHSLAYKPERC